MSKELLDLLKAIKANTDVLVAELSHKSVMPKAQETQQTNAKQSITLEQVRQVFLPIARNGLGADIKALLKKYNATKLSEVNPTDYQDLLNDAKELGK